MHTPLRVLVVEDSTENVLLLMRTLHNSGYEPTWEHVKTAETLASALDERAWDLVISEYILPQFSALDALQVLQERRCDLPFFVVSGHSRQEIATLVMKAGARGYFMKDDLTRLIPAIERELRNAQERHVAEQEASPFRAVLENITDLIVVLTAEGLIQYSSRSSERILGYKSDQWAGDNVFRYVHEEDTPTVRELLAQTFAHPGTTSTVKFRLRTTTGEWRIVEASSVTFSEEADSPHAIVTARDMTENEAHNVALQHHTLHDALTGLPNRLKFNELFAETLQTAEGRGRRFSLLHINLDRFRDINDTFGYRWGDAILQQVAPRLQGALRKGDILSRLNSDDFIILLPTVYENAGATRIARRLLQVLEPAFLVEGHKVIVGASIGIAFYPDHGTEADSLMRRVDMAMHLAKEVGSGYAFYTPEQEDRYSPDRLVLISELRQAIDHHQMQLYYQPKIDLASGTIAQVEALIRWQHPQQGLISPERFIPVAEQTGVIRTISRWVLNEGIQQCQAWHHVGIPLQVGVNLSMRDLQDAELPRTIAGLLEAWNVSPSRFEVEITETALAADMEGSLKTLTELRAMGVSITVDDFGTGYSSLSLLRRLSLNALKIDKSFVQGLTSDENDAAIVRATIDLGHNLGMKIVAEGVEDRATWDALAALGCDMIQGYFLSRPVPAEVLTQWLYESPWGQQTVATFAPPPGKGRNSA